MSAPSPAVVTEQKQEPGFCPEYYSWGRYPRVQHSFVQRANWLDQLPQLVAGAPAGSLLPYGLGRSYGDSCLNAGRGLLDCSRLNRILAFNTETGYLVCEGGVTLSDILGVCVK